ncbi:hypothetical protein B0H13DRAFT_1850915 [Mycena leptocephala]|nr:hypothetical protein B0H13DRAFT_1850915 [Mycena leptocephala]
MLTDDLIRFLFPPGAAPQPAPQQRPRKYARSTDVPLAIPRLPRNLGGQFSKIAQTAWIPSEICSTQPDGVPESGQSRTVSSRPRYSAVNSWMGNQPYYAMGYPPLPFPPQIQWQPQLPPFANPPGHFMPPPFAPPGYPPVGYRGSVLPAPAPALATLPDHSNSSPEDWPSGYVRLERVKGVEERKWKANKWGCTSRTCSLEQPLLHDECVASSYHYNYARGTETTLVWEHFGDHSTHSRPPGGKLSKFEEDEVDLQVLRKHEATAHELRTGDTGPGSTPFPDISPTLANPNAARYALGQSQARLGMVTTSSKGDLALMGGFADLGKRLSTPFIVDASVSGPVYITLQTPSMDGIIRECVESWILDLADGPSAGRHGILVDGDHSFFRVGPLIYLVQCIYISEEDL